MLKLICFNSCFVRNIKGSCSVVVLCKKYFGRVIMHGNDQNDNTLSLNTTIYIIVNAFYACSLCPKSLCSINVDSQRKRKKGNRQYFMWLCREQRIYVVTNPFHWSLNVVAPHVQIVSQQNGIIVHVRYTHPLFIVFISNFI